MNRKNMKAIMEKIGKIDRREPCKMDCKKARANINIIKRRG